MSVLTTRDGRVLAYEPWGVPDGTSVIYLHGNPGSRLRQPKDPEMWHSLGVRAVTYDRPGYGNSTRRPGRSVADSVGDVLAIADALVLDRFRLVGLSGGGPHALAVAIEAPERVAAAALVVPFAPVEPDEIDRLVPANRESYSLLREEGPDAVGERLAMAREGFLADPAAAVRSALGDIEDAADEDVERAAQAVVEGLRPGYGGWLDDSVALHQNWGFEPRRVRCPTRVWFAEDDTATPASAVRRLAERIGASRVTAWPDGGHAASVMNEREVLKDLLRVGG